MINWFNKNKNKNIERPPSPITRWQDLSDEHLELLRKVIDEACYGDITFYVRDGFSRDRNQFSVDEFDLLTLAELREQYGEDGVFAWTYSQDGHTEGHESFTQEMCDLISLINQDREKYFWMDRFKKRKEGDKVTRGWADFTIDDLRTIAVLVDRIQGYISLNLNDTFAYASAWGVDVENKEIMTLLYSFKNWGLSGAVAWASIKENVDEPIYLKHYPEFKQARKEMVKNKW